MELEELKIIWEEQSTQNVQEINSKLLKEVSLKESKGKLGEFTIENIIEFVSYIILGSYSIGFMIDSPLTAKFTVPAIVLIALSGISIYWNIYNLRFVSQMNYNTPIIELQRKLSRIRNYTKWEGKLMLVLVPIFILSLGIVVLKGVAGIDAYLLVNELGILGYVIINAALGAIIVWLIVRNEYKRFDDVNEFLKTIENFENDKSV